MDPHLPQPSGNRERFERDGPHLPRKPVRLHWKRHRRIYRANTILIQLGNDLPSGTVDFVTRFVELVIGDIASRAADRVRIHTDDKTDQRLRRGKNPQDVGAFVVQFAAVDAYESNIIRARWI